MWIHELDHDDRIVDRLCSPVAGAFLVFLVVIGRSNLAELDVEEAAINFYCLVTQNLATGSRR
ncbi:hypothetical protein L484_008199 [Morus notabilis]|uniref:Uncharacterized protein n=1 Tax=Morus notabilis TaxID=981085 RepID=W9RH35_9ROSA|nr:hypothetical protein L484_008199 [Morus notabilis]